MINGTHGPHTHTHTHTHTEFNHLHLGSDSGDADTLGPLPHGNVWGSSDGEFSMPSYDYYGRGLPLSTSSKSNSPSPGMCTEVDVVDDG